MTRELKTVDCYTHTLPAVQPWAVRQEVTLHIEAATYAEARAVADRTMRLIMWVAASQGVVQRKEDAP